MTDAELIAKLRGEPTWGGLVALTKQAADRIETLLNLNEALVELMDDRDAKLAKAVEAGQTMDDGCDCERCNKARATLAEIKGESHDPL